MVLKSGMFGLLETEDDAIPFVVVNDTIVYQDGTWDDLEVVEDNMDLGYGRIIVVFDPDVVHCFDHVIDNIEEDEYEDAIYIDPRFACCLICYMKERNIEIPDVVFEFADAPEQLNEEPICFEGKKCNIFYSESEDEFFIKHAE